MVSAVDRIVVVSSAEIVPYIPTHWIPTCPGSKSHIAGSRHPAHAGRIRALTAVRQRFVRHAIGARNIIGKIKPRQCLADYCRRRAHLMLDKRSRSGTYGLTAGARSRAKPGSSRRPAAGPNGIVTIPAIRKVDRIIPRVIS